VEELAESIYFDYHFQFENGTEETFKINLDSENLSYISSNKGHRPDWTKLEFNQCQNCQLKTEEHAYCPVAQNIDEIIEKFKGFKSYEMVIVRVTAHERIYEKAIPLQHALGSLLGIIMVTSGCPTMKILKPMVRFHLPFATVEETVYRAASCYLLGEFYKNKKGLQADWELTNLAKAYEDIQHVNLGITDRLRSISNEDANANAVVVLDVFAKALPSSIFIDLKDLEYLFQDLIDTE
jgi:hypothetical protein